MEGTLRDRLLAADDLGREPVDVPEWAEWLNGDQLYVRGMTAGEVERFGSQLNSNSGQQIMSSVAAQCTVDADGNRVFSDEDVEALAGKNLHAVKRLFDAAQAASGLEDDHRGN